MGLSVVWEFPAPITLCLSLPGKHCLWSQVDFDVATRIVVQCRIENWIESWIDMKS